MFPAIRRFFARRLPPIVVLPVAAAVLGVLAYIDWNTSPDVSLTLFYLMPVVLTTWYVGPVAGCIASVVSPVVYLAAALLGLNPYPRHFVAYWNSLVCLLFFLMVCALLTALRNFGRRLESTVIQRTAALRKLAGELAAAEDAERSRIAYDIHDSIGQTLVGLKFEVEMAASEATPESRHSQRLEKAVNTLVGLIRQARTLMFELHPLTLDKLGLVVTLQRYAEEFGRNRGVIVNVSETGIPQPVPKEIARYLFRAVKELCSNAVRHGRAKQIVVVVSWEPGMIHTLVQDDGTGFTPATLEAESHRRGLGLAGIAERVSAMGGRLHTESQPGQGARLAFEVPIPSTGEHDVETRN